MASRVQQALVKQIERQVRNQKRQENKIMYTALRHRMQQNKLVEEHFAECEFDTLQKFDLYYTRMKDAIEINKTRFDLCLNDRVDKIFANHHQPTVMYAFDQKEFDDTNQRIFESENNGLFFKNLYSPTGGRNSDPDNGGFYAVVFCWCIIFTEIIKLF